MKMTKHTWACADACLQRTQILGAKLVVRQAEEISVVASCARATPAGGRDRLYTMRLPSALQSIFLARHQYFQAVFGELRACHGRSVTGRSRDRRRHRHRLEEC